MPFAHRPAVLTAAILRLCCWLAASLLFVGAAWAQTEAATWAPSAHQPAPVEMAQRDWGPAQRLDWAQALRRQADPSVPVIDLPLELQPPADAGAWRKLDLPDAQPTLGQVGGAVSPGVQMRWYRVRLGPVTEQRLALYVPRWVGESATVLWRHASGWRVLAHIPPTRRELWSQPLWLPLPPAGADGAELVLAVPVAHDALRVQSRIWVGPMSELEARWERRLWLQSGAPQAISLTLLVLGLFAFVLWFRHAFEPGYLWFALGSAVWMLRNLHHFVEVPAQSWAQDWFWWATHAALCWAPLVALLFVRRLCREPPSRLTAAMAAVALTASLLGLPPLVRPGALPLYLYLATAINGVLATGALAGLARRRRRSDLAVITVAFGLAVLLGAHDAAVMVGWAWQEGFFVLPWAALAIMLSFLYAVQRRYAGQVEEALFANSQLQQSLDVQADAIQVQHQRLREAERQQALLLERQRLMADMHDGLGSSLLSALVAVEQGNMSQDQVVEVLRECVDDLRLVIDSLEPVGHDLVSLLATMRYRLGKRLHAGGLKLEWDVQDLPPLPWLEPPDALHVLRLMQEGLNNVVKHARASRVRMVTRHHGNHVEIRLEDDGAGFDVNAIRHGRGLKSQQKRAQRLGGKLRIDSTPGVGTRLSLRLPVERSDDPNAPSLI